MKASLKEKLDHLTERYEELAAMLASPEVIDETHKYTSYSKEYADLTTLIECYQEYKKAVKAKESAKAMLKESDPELRELATEEITIAEEKEFELESTLQILLLPKDPHDESNVYLEIRAGTGGFEAAIFVGDLFRMYARYAEHQGWQFEIVSQSESEHGGFKEIIAKVSGQRVYSKLKFESGAHRVQRVPVTESQGRIHTSACTVAVMPEVTAIDEVTVNANDLRVDTFRASGAGGQHINKTDSAIRITHIPSGIVVECQDERSQHKNRAKAMALLQARLLSAEQTKQQQEQAKTRKSLVGSGDRSERIRTYNYPQGRVTDHRINLTLYKLDEIMEGRLEEVIDPLVREYQAELLSQLSNEN